MKTEKIPLSNSPVQDETSIRNVLLFCFLVLLLLFSGIGYWSSQSHLSIERDIEEIHQTDIKYLLLVMEIDVTAEKMTTESREMFATMNREALDLSGRINLKRFKHEMDTNLEKLSKTAMREWPESQEFDESFKSFWQAVQSPEVLDWSERRERMRTAIGALRERVKNEQQKNAELTYQLSRSTGDKVLASTVAAVSFGMLVAFLTFYEIQRILARLKKAYKESSESRDYMQSLFDSMISGGVVIDSEGIVRNISNSFRKQTGLSEELDVGENYQKLFGDFPSIIDVITDDLKHQSPNNRYCGRIGPVGGRVFDLFCSPVIITNQYQGMVLGFVDITEIERAQSELRRNRALAVVGQMTAQIAHEIKNPLGSIRFAVDLLKRSPSIGGKDEETLDVINRSVEHLTEIVSELSEFARPKNLNQSDVSINDLLDDLDHMLADRLNAKNLVIEKDFAPDLPSGYYDATELRKLFLNLIINAIDATEPDGRIKLQTRLNGDGTLNVDVIDKGSGMDKETLRRLFEPFYTTKARGTGLGMAISKKIAELHRGDLVVTSSQGEGTTVSVRLPLVHIRSSNSVEENAKKAEI